MAKHDKAWWAKRLKELRADYDLTQAEAADKADVALRTWISWENEHRKPGAMAERHLRKAFSKENFD